MTNKKKIVITVGIVVGSLLAIYLGLSFYFMNHFYFRSSVNGVNVSGKTIASAKETIQKTMDEYQLVITERDGTKETIIGSEISLMCKWNNEMDRFLARLTSFLEEYP